jgi:acetyl-CoA acetyltransferase
MSDLAGRIAIVGVGNTRWERSSGRRLLALQTEAARAALADAGLEAADVDGLIMPSASYEELHAFARGLGVRRQYHHSTAGHGGAGVVAAPLHAALALDADLASTVVCVMGVDWGTKRRGDVGRPHAEMPNKASFEIPFGWYPQVVHFAGMARRYMHLYDATEEQLGAVAVAMRKHAGLNPAALLHDKPLTLDDYLAAPYLAEPFRVADCCLVNDGAAAFVMTSAERARDCRAAPVVMLGVGTGVAPEGEYSALRADYLATPATHAGPRAFEMAGLGPHDVNFLQCYDNFTSTVLLQLEDLGFCARGEAGLFAASGEIELGGALPVNTAGGQLAESFCLGASLVTEAVRQLRGACGPRQVSEAEVGLVGGYTGAQYAALLLGRA